MRRLLLGPVKWFARLVLRSASSVRNLARFITHEHHIIEKDAVGMMWVCRTRLVDSYPRNYFPIGFDGMHVVIRDQEEFHAVRLANDANMALRTLTLLRGEADDEGESIDDY